MFTGTRQRLMKRLKSNWITKTAATRLYGIPVPIIGLTGGIGSGKSTVAQLFKDVGIPVIDADKLVKSIYEKKSSYDFVYKHFPEATSENVIQFKKLREVAFMNAENQLVLENFIYSQLPDAFKEAYQAQSVHEFVVYDVPLLFEKKLNDKIDTSVCVYAPKNTQIERLVKRDNISLDLSEKILSKQMDIEDKKLKSDLYIENLSDLSLLKKNFDKLMDVLTQ